jgi:uncharacterized membrane protein YphA (DoxX/SURF4 family)
MKRWLLLAGRLGIAVIFLYAGYEKVREPWLQFAVSIDSFKVVPESWLQPIAEILPWFEIVLGVWLLLPRIISRYATVVATGMLIFFLSIGFRAYAKGLSVDCGCFGKANSGTIGPTWFVEHAAMVALGLAVVVFEFLPLRKPATSNQSADANLPDMISGLESGAESGD